MGSFKSSNNVETSIGSCLAHALVLEHIAHVMVYNSRHIDSIAEAYDRTYYNTVLCYLLYDFIIEFKRKSKCSIFKLLLFKIIMFCARCKLINSQKFLKKIG